jgi:hypothetical protein
MELLRDSSVELDWDGFEVLNFKTAGSVCEKGVDDFNEVGIEAKGNELLD